MSIFVYSDVSIKEKRTLTRKEHQSLIRKLQRGEVESTMRSLKNYKLDESLEETTFVIDLLDSLCDNSRIGIIVEWTLRQMVNEDVENKMQPIEYEREPVIVKDGPPARRTRRKAESLRMEFLRYLVSEKVANDPEGYLDEKEKDTINWEDEETSLSTSNVHLEPATVHIQSFDVYCDRSDFVIHCDL